MTEEPGQKAYDTYKKLLANRIVFIGDEIDDHIANLVIAQLLFLEQEDPHQDIDVYLKTPGGSVTAALAIFDCFHLVQCDVSTISMGTVGGVSSLLACGGAPGKRFGLPASRFQVADPYIAAGTGHEAALEKTKRTLHELYARHTGQSLERIAHDSAQGIFLNAQEAVGYGLIDGIVERT